MQGAVLSILYPSPFQLITLMDLTLIQIVSSGFARQVRATLQLFSLSEQSESETKLLQFILMAYFLERTWF